MGSSIASEGDVSSPPVPNANQHYCSQCVHQKQLHDLQGQLHALWEQQNQRKQPQPNISRRYIYRPTQIEVLFAYCCEVPTRWIIQVALRLMGLGRTNAVDNPVYAITTPKEDGFDSRLLLIMKQLPFGLLHQFCCLFQAVGNLWCSRLALSHSVAPCLHAAKHHMKSSFQLGQKGEGHLLATSFLFGMT